jgi:Secretion system C-terminal sorting domain
MMCSLLVAETMTINFSNGDTMEFDTSEILEITFGPDVSVEEMVEFISQIPIKFIKNYPNPFNPVTTISFEIGESGKAQVEIFNAKGQKVKTLLDDNLDIGAHSVDWTGNDSNNKRVSSGIYFYKVSVNGKQKIKKMLMLK